jgi:nucleotide-binding universal stress UspA family protein
MELSLAGTTLLVGIDFSESCERALDRAVRLAEQKAARLELVHVFDWTDPNSSRETSPLLSPSVTYFVWDAVAARARAARQRLDKLSSAQVGARVPFESRVVIGEPASELLSAAEHACAPVIVLGARSRHTDLCGRLGRTTERICAVSPTVVLLVLQPAPDQPTEVWVPGTVPRLWER